MLKNQSTGDVVSDSKTIDVLGKEVVLYKQRNTKNFQCRIKLKKEINGEKYFKKSTYTDDLDKARIKAIEYNVIVNSDIEEVRNSLINNKVNVSFVCQKFFEFESYNNNDKTIINKYIIPILGKKNFQSLKYTDIDYYIKEAKINTISSLDNHDATLRKLFDYALKYEYIDKINHLQIKKSNYKKNLKESKDTDIFTSEEFKIFRENFGDWRAKSKDEKTYVIRHKLLVICQLILLTGMRPGDEVEELCYKDITFKKYKDNLVGYINIRKGKKKDIEKREIAISSSASILLYHELQYENMHLINKYLDFSDKDIDIEGMNKLLKDNPDNKLFYVEGNRPEYARNFRRYINFLIDKNLISKDKNFIIYSFRHTYITEELRRGEDIYNVAKNCGTSVKMIEKYYNKNKNRINEKKVFEKEFGFNI